MPAKSNPAYKEIVHGKTGSCWTIKLDLKLLNTVEPRLSGLIGTRRNSPDNRESGKSKYEY